MVTFGDGPEIYRRDSNPSSNRGWPIIRNVTRTYGLARLCMIGLRAVRAARRTCYNSRPVVSRGGTNARAARSALSGACPPRVPPPCRPAYRRPLREEPYRAVAEKPPSTLCRKPTYLTRVHSYRRFASIPLKESAVGPCPCTADGGTPSAARAAGSQRGSSAPPTQGATARRSTRASY